jgi:hypothetical protein
MKRLLALLALVAFSSAAFAACPKGTRYHCYTDYYTKKQVCGCVTN